MTLEVTYYDYKEQISDERLKDADRVGMMVNVQESVEPYLEVCSRLHDLGKFGVVWLFFDGYDDDPREVWEIPECTAWAKKFLGTLGPRMSVLVNDLENGEGVLGIVKIHVVAGYGSAIFRPCGLYDFSVPNLVLQRILEFQKIKTL